MAYDDNSDFEQDFDPYTKKDEQDQLSQRLSALEQNLATAAQTIWPNLAYVEAQAAGGARQEIVQRLSKELDGFEAFYGSQDAREFLSSRPALGKAIVIAESRPELQQDLEALYRLGYEAYTARKVMAQQHEAQQLQEQEPSQQRAASQARKAGWSRDPSAVVGQQPQQADLSTPEKRRAQRASHMETENPMQETIKVLSELAEQRFYGSVTVKFEAGKVVLLRKEETFIPRHTQKERSNTSESKQF